ncbi:pentapeptide repeat-containing protein [Streptomyces viridochromogenes DSM 40736]|uniref:Pentapeptide repeat-containing protein n=1 Tax=Streptomyces viridochromogenes (strain DSM 40736 / JCM 4977 / BCRC 1201 / Tue 494) TaxID=591159 RepID=D9XHX3_STRVT|nr:pentapeptide repeat-containing protein [Streptomyces viridochromogenes]EFL37152.1 pentapeptide repeat-containing protein [Streptomyces viridochromogenes DSM 40736]
MAVAGLWYSNVQTQQANDQARQERALTKEGQITDRYTAAVSNLGADKMDVRLGGIYALERTMQDSTRDHPTIANVLATYIRTHAAKPPAQGQDVPADVNAALTVLTTRDTTHDKGFRLDLRSVWLPEAEIGRPLNETPAAMARADLRDTRLRGAKLDSADLRDANLGNADLRGADLTFTTLSRALLVNADLRDAQLFAADLQYAFLTDADLSGAHLRSAKLLGASLPRADLSGSELADVNLRSSNLEGADLSGSDLEDVDFTSRSTEVSGANLEGANLTGANLEGANLKTVNKEMAGVILDDANLKGANLTDANLSGADLSSVKNLTRKQLDSARTDGDTRLPAGLS